MNLLDLNDDILNIIGVYVKKDNLERKIIKDSQMRSYRQIINGKEIRFCPYFDSGIMFDIKLMLHENSIKVLDTIAKDIIKRFLFDKVHNEIKYIKVHARVDKIKLTKPDLRMCIWICFHRYFVILNNYFDIRNNNKIDLNIDDENNFLNEYLTIKKLNLKTVKNISGFLEKKYL